MTAGTIGRAPRPVLLLDTCALLDILRAPYRAQVPSGVVQAAASIVKSFDRGAPEVWVITTKLIAQEWRNNVHTVRGELDTHLKRLDRELAKASSSAAQLGIGTRFVGPTSLGLSEHLFNLSEGLLNTSIQLTGTERFHQKAMHRLLHNHAPASKGKGEPQDCLIIEQYLDLSRELRQQAYSEKIIFVSSNTKDYGRPGELRFPLAGDFKDHGIEFATSLAWAWSLIRQLCV